MTEIYNLIVVILLVWWCKLRVCIDIIIFPLSQKKKNIDIFYMKLEVNIEILLWYHLKSGLKLSTFVMFKWHCIREDDNHGNTYSKNSMMSRFHEVSWTYNLILIFILASIPFYLVYFLLNLFFPFSLIITLWMIELCSSMPRKTAKRHLTMGRCQKVDTNIIKLITKRHRSNAVKIYSIDCQTSLTTPILKHFSL